MTPDSVFVSVRKSSDPTWVRWLVCGSMSCIWLFSEEQANRYADALRAGDDQTCERIAREAGL